VIQISVIAVVKPLPDYVRRIKSADIARGEGNGAFQIWPTARPVVSVEPGERLSISLRIRPLNPESGTVRLTEAAPPSWKLRHEATDYWLDVPIDGAGLRTVPLIVELPDGRSREIRIQLTVNVPAENIVVTPREIDFGAIAISGVKDLIKRVGIRKQVGSFHIKSATSTLPFLKLEQATMVEGSNYLFRVTIDSAKATKAGKYEGFLTVETDDGHKFQVPVKITLLDHE